MEKCYKILTLWKSRPKHDHYFYGRFNIFFIKSTFLIQNLQIYDFTEIFQRDRVV